MTPGWHEDSTGKWYQNPDGTYYVNGFADIDGTTYSFDKKGYMQTGWVEKGVKDYYFNEDGSYDPSKKRPMIALTFDDGPNRYTTPKVLKILKQNNVKATFFELKPAKKDFDLTKRVLDEGHTLAMHGYQHKYDIIYRSEKTYHQNLDKLRNLFFKKFGVWCTLTRFPGGSSNTCSSYNPGIMTRLTKKLDGWGYHYFDWNVSSGDASRGTTPAQEMHNLKKETTKGHDSVVLMPDFYNNQPTLKSLDKYIKYAKKKGYTFMPLTASTAEVHHGVNN